MKNKFDKISIQCSRITTKIYSTSFSLGILFLDKSLQEAIYSIYGFVRFADEIVDCFHEHDKKYLLQKFKQDCYEAIEQKISLNPILHSFQKMVHYYSINVSCIDLFFNSMEMDLHASYYTEMEYKKYIMGSAEAVGLMCLHVFTYNNISEYNKLEMYAMKLGSAFQKVNFLRDLQQDYNELGRIYFPNIDIRYFNNTTKQLIETDIEKDFKDALIGIRQLPIKAKGGVYLAYYYYYILFNKIKKIHAQDILQKRVRISNFRKIILMMYSYLNIKLNRI